MPEIFDILKINENHRDIKAYTRYADIFVDSEPEERKRS